MADIAALKAAVDNAEADKQALVDERRANRESMTRAEFRAYNQETRARQVDVEKAVTDATKALQDALKEVRSDAVAQVLNVGTVSESGSSGGVS